MGWGEPATPPFLPDAIEAPVALERLEEARPLVAWLDERAKALRRPQLIALAARCRGLLLVGEGKLDAAEDALAEALTAHERQPLPFDQARSLLVMGEIQRRRRRWRAARERLAEARALFERLEALLWVARCEAELARLGLRLGPGGGELTPAELQVALAVSKGATNQEVAAALFVSCRTVEAHLNRIYRKLAIRSRSELTRLVLEGRLPGEPVAVAGR